MSETSNTFHFPGPGAASPFSLRTVEELTNELERVANGAPRFRDALFLPLGELAVDSIFQKREMAVRGAKRVLHVVREAPNEARAALNHALELTPPLFSGSARLLCSLPSGALTIRNLPKTALALVQPQRERAVPATEPTNEQCREQREKDEHDRQH